MWQVDGKGGSDRWFDLQEWGSDLVGCEAVIVAEGVLHSIKHSIQEMCLTFVVRRSLWE